MLCEGTGELSFFIEALLRMGVFFDSTCQDPVDRVAVVGVLMSVRLLQSADQVLLKAGLVVLMCLHPACRCFFQCDGGKKECVGGDKDHHA